MDERESGFSRPSYRELRKAFTTRIWRREKEKAYKTISGYLSGMKRVLRDPWKIEKIQQTEKINIIFDKVEKGLQESLQSCFGFHKMTKVHKSLKNLACTKETVKKTQL